ncbi:hypothetical protein KOI35_30300 [Actinoplanes bogorensis]|uniref:Tetratricopeptide repeat protein n=1 Tax=Paractinoplanes bogorensis TaxID=1610840 RepID=A0ABS5YWJ5_9ACTN|nr:hypothetical protein [Actinoplanes bogorensis]MBU2667811.1 hypothetical protein [Actinoplanes bogorensis]
MNSLGDILAALQEELQRDLDVDLGIDSLAHTAQLATTHDHLRKVRRSVKERLVMVDEARIRLASVLPLIEQLMQIWRFTPYGWPETRRKLLAALESENLAGVGPWLEFAWAALAEGRSDSLTRLLSDVPLPDGAQALTERATAAAVGLRLRDLSPVEEFLVRGRAGVEVGGQITPPGQTRASLIELQLRLAATDGRWRDVDVLLADLDRCSPEAETSVYRAMISRLNNSAPAEDADGNPSDLTGSSLEVGAEIIARARQQKDNDEWVRSAHQTIEGLPTLADVRSELDRLILPVPELWWAVAVRATREGDSATASAALDTASTQAGPSDYVLDAHICQTRASLENQPDETARLLVQAGLDWVSYGDVENARSAYERALSEFGSTASRQEVAQCQMRLSDCVIALAQDKAASAFEQQIRDGLARLDESRQVFDGDLGSYSWCYMTEAQGRDYIARLMIPDRSEQQWLAFSAALRAVAYDLDSGDRWQLLASTADSLDMNAVALWASALAEERDPSESVISTRISVLCNTGNYSDALERLDRMPADAWSAAIRANCLLRIGSAMRALDTYGEIVLDPIMTWAWSQYLMTSVIARDQRKVHNLARQLEDALESRSEEFEVLIAGAIAKLVVDAPRDVIMILSEAVDTATGSDLQDALQITAIARFVDGDPATGLATLREWVAAISPMIAATEWRMVTRPLLEAFMEMRRLPRPDVTEIEALIDATTRPSSTDPMSDARAVASRATTSPDVVDAAVSLLAAVVEVTEDSTNGSALAALPERWGAEKRRMEEQRSVRRPPFETMKPDESEGQSDDRAWNEPDIRLSLPTSWFDGHDDPVSTHPLFRRALPEARAVADWALPSVAIRASDELEPDGYSLQVANEVIAVGQMPLNAWFVPLGALGQFPEIEEKADDVYRPAWLDIELMPGSGRITRVSREFRDLLVYDRWDLVARLVTSVMSRSALDGKRFSGDTRNNIGV